VGHAICQGYISSMYEPINWPLMSNTLYEDQPLINLLNMQAGDSHTVDSDSTSYVMGSKTHHRDMDLTSIASLLEGTTPRKHKVFYNNFLSDVIASYVAYKAGENYPNLLQAVFQDKVKIENEVHFQLHTLSSNGRYRNELQNRASYSFMMTRKDLLRTAVAMMQDYQKDTCVGNYLRELQAQAKRWPGYSPSSDNSFLYANRYARKYGGQFYFDFYGMNGRNIVMTAGKNGQNIVMDMDNSRIIVTQSAASGWDRRAFLLDVIREGKLLD